MSRRDIVSNTHLFWKIFLVQENLINIYTNLKMRIIFLF